jgi:uncharacterized protein involved in exopolysaccharide biosynthesis
MIDETEQNGDLISIVHLLKHHKRLLAWGALASWALVYGVFQFAHNRYETEASFMPSGSSQSELGSALSGMSNGLGGLAASVGLLSGGGTGTMVPPKFYADLVTSDAILLQVLDTTGRNPYNYIKIYGLKSKTPEDLRVYALDHLRRRIKVDLDPRTAVITIKFAGRTPEFSVQVMHTLLDAVNRFNIQTLQTTARARTRFTEARVGVMKDDVSVAEGRLRDFLTENRTYAQSPLLTLRQLQLRQDYTLKNEMLVSLENTLEKARLDEVRDTPVLTVLDQPLLPGKATYPPRFFFGVEAAIAWLVFASVFFVVRSSYRAANAAHQRRVEGRPLGTVSGRRLTDAAAD